MGSSSGASVGSCARPRPQQYNMVARTTILVVFTIVLAATGVFVPEADRDLEESDGSRESLNSLEGFVDVSESGHLLNSRLKVKRETKIRKLKGKEVGKRVIEHQRRKRIIQNQSKMQKVRKKEAETGK